MHSSATVYFLTKTIQIVVEYTQHRIDHLKVYSLVVLCFHIDVLQISRPFSPRKTWIL